MTAIDPACFRALRDPLHAASFTPRSDARRSIGAEVEFLLLDSAGRPVPLERGPSAIVPWLRRFAARTSWREFAAYDGTPRFDVPGHATISFEPGGQLEISTVPCASVSELVRVLRAVVEPLRAALLEDVRMGVSLRSVGIDPYNDARDIALQLHVERYEKMTRYFERIGPFGIRMMRQTAAIQISIDRGKRPAERWRLLNDLAPFLIAIFANSPRYRGEETGHRSYRAHCWRMLDPGRTGVAGAADDPASAYTRFALAARDMMRTDAANEHQPFASWASRDDWRETRERWPAHLTMLFPEVRPRGHFEIRSCDAIDPARYAAPLVFVAGLAYDRRASAEAALLAEDSRALLRTAGEIGLRDVAIARVARDLFQLALSGARRLGSTFVDGETIEAAETFYADYTARDRSPADDWPLLMPAPDARRVTT